MGIYVNPQQMILFLFVLLRVSITLFMIPFFSGLAIPATIKGLLCIALALCLYQFVSPSTSITFIRTPWHLLVAILGEISLGLFWGLVVRLVLAIFQLAGEFIGYQLGFSIANIMDPQSGLQLPLLSQWFYLVAMLVFFAVNAHYIVIKALIRSIRQLPPGTFVINLVTLKGIRTLSFDMFVISLKISAPITAVLLFTQVAMGIIAKTVPQMNILISAFPLTIFLGLLFLGLSMEMLGPYIGQLILNIHQYLNIVFI